MMMEIGNITVRFTGPNSDKEFWLHLSDGKRHSGINLGYIEGGIGEEFLTKLSEGYGG